ncbi:MAG: hydroxymethylbilane synthase [Dehalococcoidia bacterium]
MSQRSFRIGTRGSRLALRQTEIVLKALRRLHPGASFEVRPVRTAGDQQARASLSEIGGRGVFVTELERELLRGDIDIAVHSLKDLPSEETAGLLIAAVCRREDARDALIAREGRKLAGLPAGASVGTGSPRRAAQVRAARPDLRLADIRGNVDTRIRKVQAGEVDAVVLAAAGLARLGWLGRASEVIPPEVMLPAVGQGALALQVRADDAGAIDLARAVDDAPTRQATAAERAFLRRLGGGCQAAIAAFAETDGEELRLRGLVAAAGEGGLLRGEVRGATAEAEDLGAALAESLLARGASALLATAPSGEAAP